MGTSLASFTTQNRCLKVLNERPEEDREEEAGVRVTEESMGCPQKGGASEPSGKSGASSLVSSLLGRKVRKPYKSKEVGRGERESSHP